jgi:hypothetical protein
MPSCLRYLHHQLLWYLLLLFLDLPSLQYLLLHLKRALLQEWPEEARQGLLPQEVTSCSQQAKEGLL